MGQPYTTPAAARSAVVSALEAWDIVATSDPATVPNRGALVLPVTFDEIPQGFAVGRAVAGTITVLLIADSGGADPVEWLELAVGPAVVATGATGCTFRYVDGFGPSPRPAYEITVPVALALNPTRLDPPGD